MVLSAFTQGEVLFQESFEGDLSRWNAPKQWRIEEGTLIVEGGGIALCREGGDWTNIAIEFDTEILSQTSEWVFRAKSPEDCVFTQFAGPHAIYHPGHLRDHLFRGGTPAHIFEVPLPFEPEDQRTYRVRVEILGESVRTFMDDRWVDEFSIQGYEKGTIGFRGANGGGRATFDNLVVKKLNAFTPIPEPPWKHREAERREQEGRPSLDAAWIWRSGEGLDRWFRKRIDLGDEVLLAKTVLTADNAFTLYVNGKKVTGSDHWERFEEVDLSSFFRKGENLLALHVHNEGPGSAGLLLQSSICLKSGKTFVIQSEATWKVKDQEEQGWFTLPFDDSYWEPAEVIGPFGCGPWDRVTDSWDLPYLGEMTSGILTHVKLPDTVTVGEPLTLKWTVELNQPFTLRFRSKLKLVSEKGESGPLDLDLPVEKSLAQGKHPFSFSKKIDRRLYLEEGFYAIHLDIPGLFFQNAPDGQLGRIQVHQRALDGNVISLSDRKIDKKTYTDQWGRSFSWSVGPDRIFVKDQGFFPVRDSDGVYWCEANEAVPPDLIDETTLQKVKTQGLTQDMVRCRIVDVVDCANDANCANHAFSEDGGYGGKSRVLSIHGKPYRVTSARKATSYFALTIRCRRPSFPHVLAFETPNDLERYTLIRVQPPWDNVGCGPFTGRDLPLDGESYVEHFLFYPREENIRITVSRLPCELDIQPESGAAVSKIWLLEILDDMRERKVETHVRQDLPQRRLGISVTHPFYLYTLYGFQGQDPLDRKRSLLSFLDYASFVGLNYLEYNAVNGSDVSWKAYYPSEYFEQMEDHSGAACDLFAELLPLAEENGLDVVPCLTSLSFDMDRYTDAPWITEETFQIDADGVTKREFFKNRGNDNVTPDPLRPEVQKVFLGTIEEMAERCKESPAVKGIAFRVNGKIGTCYTGYNRKERAETAGYSPWNIQEFEKDTGIDVPTVQPTPYVWLKENAWEAWMDWRCQRTKALWLKARNIVSRKRPDWKLVAKCDLPSETPGRNILWPEGYDPLELFRTYGYDPRLYEDEESILVQQGYFIGGGRYFHVHGPSSSYYHNPEAWKAFDYQENLWKLYANKAGYSCEFYHNYWEEFGISHIGEFRTSFWGAGMMYPKGRHFLQPLAYALRKGNADTLLLFSWERGTQGHEAMLRRFSRAYRALPAVEGKPFRGRVLRTGGRNVGDRVWIQWFADRLAVLNDQSHPVTLRITLPEGRNPGGILVDYASQRTLWEGAPGDQVEIQLDLDIYDLRALGFLSR